MRKTRYILSLLLCLLLCTGASAQYRDSRGRVAKTIIADGLAQLPAKNLKQRDQVAGEMARTGAEGIRLLAGMIEPGKSSNAPFEYAIDAVTTFVSQADRAELRPGVHDGLVEAIKSCGNNVTKAFLLSQLERIPDKKDLPLLTALLQDKELRDPALAVLCRMEGIDRDVERLMKEGTLPHDALARLAYSRGMSSPDVEETLLSWLPSADKERKTAILNALTLCGGERSLKALGAEAAAENYSVVSPTGATDAYIRLLTRMAKTEPKTVQKAARNFMKQQNEGLRCAGLLLNLMTAKKPGDEVLKALKDGSRQYRNTALDHAEEYAGPAVYAAVAKKAAKLGDDALIDVVNWLGNHHAQAQVQTVIAAMGRGNKALTQAAIRSAGRIGGQSALEALLPYLATDYKDEATKALLSFNGDISSTLLKYIDQADNQGKAAALGLLCQRPVKGAYGKLMQLVDSPDPAVSKTAAKALKGAVDESNFTALCQKLEQAKAGNVGLLQDAAVSSLRNLTADEQYARISSVMSQSAQPALYYPMLARAGNSQAVDALLKAYAESSTKEAAYQSLLRVDSPAMIDVLYGIARKDEAARETALSRYATLVGKAGQGDEAVYLNVERALQLRPTAKVARQLINLLSSSSVYPALPLVAVYLNSDATSREAATIVKTILRGQTGYQGGDFNRRMLNKSLEVFKAWKQSGNADAGYAMDEINGVLKKFRDTGFAPVSEKQQVGASVKVGSRTVGLAKDVENFEAYLEWEQEGEGLLFLRSMPAVKLGPTVSYIHGGKAVEANRDGWNLLYIRFVDDRLTVKNNGRVVCDNVVMQNMPTDAALLFKGDIELVAGHNQLSVRNVYVNRLPATPLARLSAEEKKQGFELLFDGRSLTKWHGNTTNYVPRDGCIYVNAHYGNGGNLYSNKEYSDFIYRFEFAFVSPGVNNGIGIRTRENVDAAYEGMEIQVLDHDDPIYSNLSDYQQHGSVYGIIVPKHVKFGKLGTWNTEEIRAVGDRITVTVNGEVILDGNIREACQGHNVAPDGSQNNPYTVDHHNHPGLFNKSGNISFCGHGEGVMFRNIRILDLSKKRR